MAFCGFTRGRKAISIRLSSGREVKARSLWIVDHYAVTPDLPGGTRHYDIARCLAARGWQVTVWTSAFHHGIREDVRLRTGGIVLVEEVSGVTFAWVRSRPTYQAGHLRRALNMADFARRVAWLGTRWFEQNALQKPDIVIGSSPDLLAAASACWLSAWHRARFFLEVRDLWPQVLVDMGVASRRSPLICALRGLESLLYKRAKGVVFVPSKGAEYLQRRGVPPEQLLWMPNGVDIARFEGGAAIEKEVGELTILYAGAHGPANRLDLLLDAARRLQHRNEGNLRFVLVGEGTEKPRLVELARGWKLANVEFRQAVPKNEIPSLILQADVCVVDTDAHVPQYGTGPNKLPDYLACGKPVIILSDQKQDAVEKGFGFRVPALSAAALADALLRFRDMPRDDLRRMGTAARAHAEEHYDVDRLTGRLEQFLLQENKKR